MQAMLGWAAAVPLLAAAPALAQDQAAAGHAAYDARCATCHAADLGGHEGPQLRGSNFLRQWGDKTTAALADYIKTRMPPQRPDLGAAEAAELTAFILASNGAGTAAQAPSAALTVAAAART